MLLTRQVQDSDLKYEDRLRKTLIKYSVILGIGLLYLIFVLSTGIRIPCLFYELTGLKCPGCGVTRMLVSIARLDFAAALHYNPFLFVTGPIIVAYLAAAETKYVLHGNRSMGKWQLLLWAELILLLAYGILRNII